MPLTMPECGPVVIPFARPTGPIPGSGSGQRVLVRHLMGTAFSLDLRDAGLPDSLPEEAWAALSAIEARFSPFRADSELCALWRGESDEATCSEEMRRVLALADNLAVRTGGAFDARRWRADGHLDPSGLVKGWAAGQAGALLHSGGARNFALNAGGDVLAAGEAAPGQPWRVGLRDPDDPARLVAIFAVRDLAVATSGLYERAAHIRDPRRGAEVVSPWRSLSVVGPDLGLADAYATAALVLGDEGPALVAAQPGYGAYGLHVDGRAYWTPVVATLLTA
jgi:thiamine biosynthesis lipoprotein